MLKLFLNIPDTPVKIFVRLAITFVESLLQTHPAHFFLNIYPIGYIFLKTFKKMCHIYFYLLSCVEADPKSVSDTHQNGNVTYNIRVPLPQAGGVLPPKKKESDRFVFVDSVANPKQVILQIRTNILPPPSRYKSSLFHLIKNDSVYRVLLHLRGISNFVSIPQI